MLIAMARHGNKNADEHLASQLTRLQNRYGRLLYAKLLLNPLVLRRFENKPVIL